MKEAICANPFFGIAISIIAYFIGQWVNRKTRLAVLNPLLIAFILIIAILLVFDIPLSWYREGGDMISMFLSPVTSVLAITIYQQRKLIKEHFAAILAGSITASLTSIGSVYLMSRLVGFDEALTASLLPKSITTPMAIAVSNSIGGIEPLTVLAVIVAGVTGSVLGPVMVRIFHFRDEVAQGMSFGAASHALGTSRAIELGEIQGALSSVSLVCTGIATVVISLFLH